MRKPRCHGNSSDVMSIRIPKSPTPATSVVRACVLAAGLAALQAFLIGPSLVGSKLFLPLDTLALKDYYLPRAPEYQDVRPRYPTLIDHVIIYEFQRRFAAQEFRAGRLPLWSPHQYGGAASAAFPKYSPFNLLYYLFPTPKTLAWMRLLQVIVGGIGVYVFCRRVLAVSFWPATVAAWCFPLTGFFVLWQGFPMPPPVAWFPWLLVGVEEVFRRPRRAGGPVLALLTGVLLVSGQADVSAQVLLVVGLYALGRLAVEYRRTRQVRALLRIAATLSAAWLLGIMLAAPYLWTLYDYAGESSRMGERREGAEDRPPEGIRALPQTVIPDIYGSMRQGSFRIVDGTRTESSAGAYTGVLATLLLAPLAWLSRRHRSHVVLWLVLGLLGLAWSLNVPGLVALMRLPGINMLSSNRFVFVTSFAVLAMAAVALDLLRSGPVGRHRWYLAPVALLVGLGSWCVYRSYVPPQTIAQLGTMVEGGFAMWTLTGPDDLSAVRQSFRASYLTGALWCCVASLGWLLAVSRDRRVWLVPVLAVLWIAELVGFARGQSPQSEPELYYPRLPVLEKLSHAPPGRVLGVRCLPPRLMESHGLKDIRGLDGIEPARAVKVLRLAANPRFASPDYAATMWYVPQIRRREDGGLDLPPVLDMFNVRYLVFRGTPDPASRPFLVEDDYWVLENEDALPRVFVPRRVEAVEDEEAIPERMASADFDPRRVAFVREPVGWTGEVSGGTVEVVEELPRRVTVAFDLPSPALVVLSENWAPGWSATVDGRPVAHVRANYTLNAAVVPGGQGQLVFHYAPDGFYRGMVLTWIALGAALAWLIYLRLVGGAVPASSPPPW